MLNLTKAVTDLFDKMNPATRAGKEEKYKDVKYKVIDDNSFRLAYSDSDFIITYSNQYKPGKDETDWCINFITRGWNVNSCEVLKMYEKKTGCTKILIRNNDNFAVIKPDEDYRQMLTAYNESLQEGKELSSENKALLKYYTHNSQISEIKEMPIDYKDIFRNHIGLVSTKYNYFTSYSSINCPTIRPEKKIINNDELEKRITVYKRIFEQETTRLDIENYKQKEK